MTDSLNSSLPVSYSQHVPSLTDNTTTIIKCKTTTTDELDVKKEVPKHDHQDELDSSVVVGDLQIETQLSPPNDPTTINKTGNDTTTHPLTSSHHAATILSSLLTDQQQQQFLQMYTSSQLTLGLDPPSIISTLPRLFLPQDDQYTKEDSTTQYTLSHRPPIPSPCLSNDERRQQRLLRNRMAAKESRKKKKHYILTLEEKVARLEKDNATLRQQLEVVNSKLDQGTENYRLMKEVVALNAKLGDTEDDIDVV
ncbi:hypothetical protein BC941DRAFT_410558 [Chlamydoabsidia padenii]|nr:hypothetical protein BC941DRAFT_410558 [Chlamydoabsidia padenii]